ncbi:unnamed protein product [Arctogadus glacialis]
MLLRVILSQDDIRRITIDNMPETVIGLHLMLKNKLGLEGDLVVQFQDSEFDNELCNLSCMSELPKDKIEAEFARLTSVDLKGSLFAGLDKNLLRFLEVYRARSVLSILDNDVTDAEEDWTKGMAVGILMVEQIKDWVCFAVVLEEEIIFACLSYFPTAVALLMGLLFALDIQLFALDIHYPRGVRYTSGNSEGAYGHC